MNHLETWEFEKAWESGDAAWFAWLKSAEKAMGLENLDGTEWEDGYSIDSAYDAFLVGISPNQYAVGKRAD